MLVVFVPPAGQGAQLIGPFWRMLNDVRGNPSMTVNFFRPIASRSKWRDGRVIEDGMRDVREPLGV